MNEQRRVAILALAGLGSLLGSSARADQLEATLRQPLRETSHAIDVKIKDGVATYLVRRSFANAGSRHDEASLGIELPPGAAATGLRIRSGRRWYDGDLLERERAGELYRELTGIGPHTPRDPALLQWVWANELHLQVFPVPPGGTSTVEYRLTVPTRYAQGRYLLSYSTPAPVPNLAPGTLRVFPESPRASVRVDGQLAAAAQPVILLPPRREGWLARQKLAAHASHVVSAIALDRPGSTQRVEVELDIRHSYRGDLIVQLVTPSGLYHKLVSREGKQENDLRRKIPVKLAGPEKLAGSWRLLISDHARADVGSLERWALGFESEGKKLRVASADTPLFLPDAPEAGGAGLAAIEVTPPPIETLVARLGRVVAAPGKELLRLEVDAAPELRPKPRAPRVVFVVDASRSLGEQGIEGELQLIRSFLSHLPDASCEVVVFRRRAARIFGRLASSAEVPALLEAARGSGAFAAGNGSALEEGVRLATSVLRPGPTGPRFLIMLGDARLRSSFRNRSALEELARTPSSTVSHLAVLSPGRALGEERDDQHPLAPLAAVRAGVLLKIEGLPTSTAKQLDPIALGLVRPIRIDSFRVRGLPEEGFPEPPRQLEEGSGVREMAMLASAPRRLILTGKIWAAPFRRVLQVSESFSRVTAALAFPHDLHADLSKAQMLRLAFLGRAVSPVTSYLAIEPGVRPSRAGIERGRGRLSSRRARSPMVMAGMASRSTPDLKSLLAPAARACLEAHPGAARPVSLAVETTLDEVVDAAAAGNPDPLRRCLEEAAWSLQLPARFRGFSRQRFALLYP